MADDSKKSEMTPQEAWDRLRGIAKDIFSDLGGGEAYLRKEREDFYTPQRARQLQWRPRSPVTKRYI